MAYRRRYKKRRYARRGRSGPSKRRRTYRGRSKFPRSKPSRGKKARTTTLDKCVQEFEVDLAAVKSSHRYMCIYNVIRRVPVGSSANDPGGNWFFGNDQSVFRESYITSGGCLRAMEMSSYFRWMRMDKVVMRIRLDYSRIYFPVPRLLVNQLHLLNTHDGTGGVNPRLTIQSGDTNGDIQSIQGQMVNVERFLFDKTRGYYLQGNPIDQSMPWNASSTGSNYAGVKWNMTRPQYGKSLRAEPFKKGFLLKYRNPYLRTSFEVQSSAGLDGVGIWDFSPVDRELAVPNRWIRLDGINKTSTALNEVDFVHPLGVIVVDLGVMTGAVVDQRNVTFICETWVSHSFAGARKKFAE